MDMILKRKNEIMHDLRNKDVRYELYTPKNIKSKFWRNFQLIKFENKPEDFARCIQCKDLVKYSTKTGTGGLIRHRHKFATWKASPKQTSLNKPSTKQTCTSAKDEIAKLQIVTKDLRPLEITEGAGFKGFAQARSNVGADYDKQDSKELLGTRQTLVGSVKSTQYKKIKTELQQTLQRNAPAFNIDMWTTDEQSRGSFLTPESQASEFSAVNESLLNAEAAPIVLSAVARSSSIDIESSRRKPYKKLNNNELSDEVVTANDGRFPETQFDYAAKSWAITINTLPREQQLIATRIINEMLYQAQMGNLNSQTKLLFSQPISEPMTVISQPVSKMNQFETIMLQQKYSLCETPSDSEDPTSPCPYSTAKLYK